MCPFLIGLDAYKHVAVCFNTAFFPACGQLVWSRALMTQRTATPRSSAHSTATLPSYNRVDHEARGLCNRLSQSAARPEGFEPSPSAAAPPRSSAPITPPASTPPFQQGREQTKTSAIPVGVHQETRRCWQITSGHPATTCPHPVIHPSAPPACRLGGALLSQGYGQFP